MYDILETFSDRGPELTIPSFTFQSGRQYFIKSSLIKMENDETITSVRYTIIINTTYDMITF